MLAEHRAWSAQSNTTDESNYQGGLGAYLFVNEDYRGAIAAWVKSADLNATNTLTDLAHAIRAALWAGDRATVEELQARYDAVHLHGRTPAAWRATVAAALAALDGRREEAIAQYANARALWADCGVVFEGALVGIDMLMTLGPDEPAVPRGRR